LIDDLFNIYYVAGALFTALWIMIPAYVPNPIAVVVGGGTPIDLGKNYRDGRRMLGDGKTYRGFFGGIMGGIVVGILLIWVQGLLGFSIHTLPSVILLAIGALTGDLVKSFFKRRLNKKRGEEWLIADQYDLVAGALAMVALFDLPWLIANVTPAVAIWIIVATPLLHRGANIIGYLAGMKDVPW
jgi:CDP-2,3-bis-(O-geranylgeranyl)-sn-glycerol synthase